MFGRENIKSIVHSLFFERFITIVILVNSILVGVETANSDGNIIANEKGSINSLAEFFEVKKPFI